MNKYQKALRQIHTRSLVMSTTDQEEIINRLASHLKELVDKATPMKPKNIKIENLVETGFIPLPVAECGKCDCEIHVPHNYCWHCGQAIKWSEDDEL